MLLSKHHIIIHISPTFMHTKFRVLLTFGEEDRRNESFNYDLSVMFYFLKCNDIRHIWHNVSIENGFLLHCFLVSLGLNHSI